MVEGIFRDLLVTFLDACDNAIVLWWHGEGSFLLGG